MASTGMGIVDERTVTSPPKADAPVKRLPLPGRIAPGTRIRQYEVIRELGRGGMGRVFLARDTRLARRVALKFLTQGEQGLTASVLAEARATARCTHENIVVIHEVDEHERQPYLVLEYLEGTTLRGLMDRRVSWGRAVELVLPIVRALVQAHEFGIVHRDLKPENVFVTSGGVVKVLDFGIATLQNDNNRTPSEEIARRAESAPAGVHPLVGTVRYMSPEQVGAAPIDHRSDLWAVGLILYELISGSHPFASLSFALLVTTLTDLEHPIPALADVPDELQRIVARCVAKRSEARYATARELCVELEKLVPGRTDRRLGEDSCPYPGLAAFQETDADRFFGRDSDTARIVSRVRDKPLIGIIGASGVGKSSLVRAGVLPALRASGEPWSVITVRPGRSPLASLAGVTTGGQLDLMTTPGALGAMLRARAASEGTKTLLFVDQFEELYTLCADPAQRRAYTAALSGVADDANGPLRVVIAMRSDFLDRIGEDARFLDDLTRGLVFVQPLDQHALRDALVRPLQPLGYSFESPAIVDDLVGSLSAAPGALPLLQFAASRLWEARDREQRWLTRAKHDHMGGIAGALATYADEVLATLAPPAQRLTRTVLQRLITPERTRAIVSRSDLRGLSTDEASIDAVVDLLVHARLLVVQQTEETTVELVHESLIRSWPTLTRWLDEDHEDAAYLAQVRTAAAQWDQKKRAPGLVWRGEAEREARLFRARYRGALGARESAFLDAVVQLGGRSARVRRTLLVAGIALLSLIAVGSAIALIMIRHAEQDTVREAERAQDEARKAQQETERARAAENKLKVQVDQLNAEQHARVLAEQRSRDKDGEVQMSREQLQAALRSAQDQQRLAEQESQRARAAEARAAQEAKRAEEQAKRAEAREEEERKKRLEQEERGKNITKDLPR
jgi:eukaryotic-like serine/threonine-protein kinase